MSSPITGLHIIYGEHTSPPVGYRKIPADLNKGAGGEYIYLCYSTTVQDKPITNIQVFAGSSSDFPIQSGYARISKDLNKGAGGKYIYICFMRDSDKFPPVQEVNVIQGGDRYTYPPDNNWVRIDQDCSEGAGGDYTYITYHYH